MEQKTLWEAAPPRLSQGWCPLCLYIKPGTGWLSLVTSWDTGVTPSATGMGIRALMVPVQAPRPSMVSPWMGTSCCTHPDALGAADFGGAWSFAQTPGSQPPSCTPSPSAGGCASPGASSHGCGKREAERLYFNTPLWVGDLEKQLGESKSVKSNLPRCCRAQGDLHKAMEEVSVGAGPPALGLQLGTPLWAPRVPKHCPLGCGGDGRWRNESIPSFGEAVAGMHRGGCRQVPLTAVASSRRWRVSPAATTVVIKYINILAML